MIKEIVEPMFASMLPGPLATLHFVKLDLGTVPLKLLHVDVHRLDQGGIKLDMDVSWQGECDIDLDGNLVPKLGVERIHLNGRLSILLAPLTDIIPLVRDTLPSCSLPTEGELSSSSSYLYANDPSCRLERLRSLSSTRPS